MKTKTLTLLQNHSSTVFTQLSNVLFCTKIQFRVLWSRFQIVEVSQSFFVFMISAFLKRYFRYLQVRYLIECPSVWVCLMSSHDYTGFIDLEWGDTAEIGDLLNVSHCRAHDISMTQDWGWQPCSLHEDKVVSANFFTIKFVFFPFHTLLV